MSGGMRIDPRELPLPLREQVATKIVAELAKASPVVGHQETQKIKVRVRRLRFRSPQSAHKYEELRRLHYKNPLTEMILMFDGEGYVKTVTYQHTEVL